MVDYLRSQGLAVTATYPNHLMVDARGTVAQTEQAFQVHINDYQDALGQHFFANDVAPSLPTPLAAMVTSVTGLDNLAQYKRVPPSAGQKKPTLATKKAANLSITCPMPGAATVPTSYTPSQIASAYDFNQLYGQAIWEKGRRLVYWSLMGIHQTISRLCFVFWWERYRYTDYSDRWFQWRGGHECGGGGTGYGDGAGIGSSLSDAAGL